MSPKLIGNIARQLSTLEWKWSKAAWDVLASGLGLKAVEFVCNRVSYTWMAGIVVDAFFVNGELEFVEITTEVFRPSEPLGEVAYENKVDEFYAKYREAVATVTEHLGRPMFNDGAGAVGFPEDQDANWLALWNIPDARLMIEQKHEDKELPFRICVVVAQPLRDARSTVT